MFVNPVFITPGRYLKLNYLTCDMLPSFNYQDLSFGGSITNTHCTLKTILNRQCLMEEQLILGTLCCYLITRQCEKKS